MFRNALAATLRHLYREKMYVAIAVFGLAVGLCAALLAALCIRSEYSHEHFVSGYQDLYLATTIAAVQGRGKNHSVQTPQLLAGLMEQRFPEVASASRMASESVMLRLGDVELGGKDHRPVASVDPDFFDTAPLTVLAGDPAAALAKPDTVVMTREAAQRLFGEDSPLGGMLEAVSGGRVVTLTVGAVVADIPVHGSRVFSGISVFVSGESAWTALARFERPPQEASPQFLRGYVTTLVRLKPDVAPQSVRAGMAGLSPQLPGWQSTEELNLIRIDRVATDPGFNPAFTTTIAVMSALALVVLFIAGVNFVNLLTARSGMRTLEVGVRKLAGASRATLVLQFLVEALLHVMMAAVVAVAMTELLLPHVSAFMRMNADFAYWREPALLGWMLSGTVLFGLLAGCWPAVVLSRKRPSGAMRGARLAGSSRGFLRQLLVAVQFALLIAMMLKVGVMYLQHNFAGKQALRFDADRVLILDAGCSPGRMAELRKLAGVSDAACSGSQLLGGEGTTNGVEIRARDGQEIPMAGVWIDDRMLGLYGVKPLAGRDLVAADFGEGNFGRHSTRVLINESAMRELGFESPAAAIGPYPLMQDTPALRNGRPAGQGLSEIIGVVPDFSMASVRHRIGPTLYYADPMQFSTISVKLKGGDIPETLVEIDRVWKNTLGRGGEVPVGKLDRYFYDERVERINLPWMFEARVFGIVSLVAISLALLGLLGLAASMAERRTKEIGIRKALGADTGDVLGMLLWQFAKPLVWANLLVWPVMGYRLQGWLEGFAYRIDMPLWLFPVTGLAVLLVALATVGAQALAVARLTPVTSLRHE